MKPAKLGPSLKTGGKVQTIVEVNAAGMLIATAVNAHLVQMGPDHMGMLVTVGSVDDSEKVDKAYSFIISPAATAALINYLMKESRKDKKYALETSAMMVRSLKEDGVL